VKAGNPIRRRKGAEKTGRRSPANRTLWRAVEWEEGRKVRPILLYQPETQLLLVESARGGKRAGSEQARTHARTHAAGSSRKNARRERMVSSSNEKDKQHATLSKR